MTEHLKEGAFEQQEHHEEAAGYCEHGGILRGRREGACRRHDSSWDHSGMTGGGGKECVSWQNA